MFKTIADPADCEVHSVIRFLNAKNVKPVEIHRQLVEIYGENVMSDGMVRKWVRQFNAERTDVHDEAWSGWPSVVNDGLVAKVNEKIPENRRFTIRLLCDEFPQISNTVLHEIVATTDVQQWLSSLAASFFEEGIDKLVSRYDKCLNNGCNYVEK
ncbi:putative uncharacterized protein FLJ37770 [Centruroides sculpturatus]|uniref:putative uncharacterized protein FLJ37770 n=1 Tax=Centruroides sculpturatus TaxID=218467 RepID=UPI000C6D601D|nr:putative uncharacterized protein FLJ37770 [Centruroides sculpturatus]